MVLQGRGRGHACTHLPASTLLSQRADLGHSGCLQPLGDKWDGVAHHRQALCGDSG